jgi:hypothetical protein
MAEYTIGELEGIAALGELLFKWLDDELPERTESAELLVGNFRVPVTDRDGNTLGELVVDGAEVTFEIKESK